MQPIFVLDTFTPAEAEAITGLPVAAQRDWRRHGHLPASSSGGHTRYDVFGLANMTAMRALSGHVPLKDAKDIAYWATHRIAKTALAWVNSWIVEQGLAHPAAAHQNTWGDLADWLTRKLFAEHLKDGRVVPGGKLIIWADGTETFQESIDAAFANLTTDDAKVQGAVTILDLDALAGAIVDKAGRPFAHALPSKGDDE